MSEKYFDLHIDGIGYLNRVREVRPRRGGEPFLAVDISALHGSSEAPQRTRFDCRVVGDEARHVLQEVIPAIQAGLPVLATFRLGDLYAEAFTYRHGERTGETGISLKARLLRLGWVRINGEPFWEAQRGDPSARASSEAAAATPEEPLPEPELDSSELPAEVALSRTDPDFQIRKQRLKELGYRFDPQAKVWRLPAAA